MGNKNSNTERAPRPIDVERLRAGAALLYDADQIEAAIVRMGEEISAALGDKKPVVLCLMKGALVVTGKLLPLLDFPLQLEYVHVSRYHGVQGAATPTWDRLPAIALQNRHVLIIDDVLDEGVTLKAAIDLCRDMRAESVTTAVLVNKQLGRERACEQADIVGLDAPDFYLFGYGMDYMEYLRNAPGIYRLGKLE